MNDAIRAAAQEIATLINTRPQSPRIDELEAIIASAMTCQDTPGHVMAPAPAVLEWHRQLAEDDRKWNGTKLSDAEWDALHDGQVSRAKQAFARPVRSWEDVALLGALCIYWNFPHHDSDDQANMRELLGRPSRIGMDEQTLAHLLKAICTMGGFAPGEIPTTATTAISAEDVDALRQRLADLQQLYEIDDGSHAATEKADAADNELTALSERIFATRPITLHNLKQRAVLAKYWQEHNPPRRGMGGARRLRRLGAHRHGAPDPRRSADRCTAVHSFQGRGVASMQNNRRQFLGSLARGLLLPVGGGALTLADPAKAARLQVTQGALPMSADAMRLRSLKRDLRRVHEAQDDYPSLAARTEDWRALMRQVRPVEQRILERSATSWTDVVELAEVSWWGIAHRGDRYGDYPASVLAKAVLSLGGGERFYLHDEGEAPR